VRAPLTSGRFLVSPLDSCWKVRIDKFSLSSKPESKRDTFHKMSSLRLCLQWKMEDKKEEWGGETRENELPLIRCIDRL